MSIAQQNQLPNATGSSTTEEVNRSGQKE